MAKKIQYSQRTENARVIRALQDLKRLILRVNDSVETATKTIPKKDKEGQEAIRSARNGAVTMRMNLQVIVATMKRLGINTENYADVELTEQEKIEITGLLYCGMDGDKLYTRKEIAQQYGTTVAVIREIERNVPI